MTKHVSNCSLAPTVQSDEKKMASWGPHTSATPHLYAHGDRDMLAMVDPDMLAISGSSEGSRTSLTVLPFSLVLCPNLAELSVA